jgi:hypothetical protein
MPTYVQLKNCPEQLFFGVNQATWSAVMSAVVVFLLFYINGLTMKVKTLQSLLRNS